MADDPAWAGALAAEAEAAPAAPPAKPAWADAMAKEAQGSHPSAPHHAAPATRHPAAAPVQGPAPNEPELTWGETGKQALHNAVPSLVDAGKSIGSAIAHPVKTVQALGDIGGGLLSQAAGAVGIKQDPAQKARTEALAKALEHHYGQTYGSVKGFKRAFASDPTSIAMDAATFIPGVGVGAKAAGLTKTASVLGKIGSAIDPVANAVRVAKIPVKAVSPLVRGMSGAATGVPPSLLKVAGHAGETTDPALRGAFHRFYSGQGDASEFLQTAQTALGKVRGEASADYLAKKGTLLKAQPSFQPVHDAIAKARTETMKGGVNVGQFKEANKAIDDVEALVNGWKTAPDPSYQSLEGFDNLKQAIWDLRDASGNSAAQRHLGAVYNGAKQAITDLDPEYARLMEQYQTARNNIVDTQKTLVGAARNPSATTAMAKSLRALKTGTGKNLFGQLAEHEPTLPYMLAGHALHPWAAGGKAGLFEGAAIPLAGLTGVMAHDPVLGGAQLIGQVAAQSPKVAGATAYGLGAAGRHLERSGAALRAPYYTGRVSQEMQPELGPPVDATPEEIDAATRMVMAEAGGEGAEGQAAALHTALNRARLSGEKLGTVLAEPNAFEAVTNGNAGKFDPESPEYKHIRDEIVIPSLRGDLPDPTEGATHYLNPDLQLAKKRHIPTWAMEGGQRIGQHVFFKHPEDFAERPHRASGGRAIVPKVDDLVDRLMQRHEAARKAVRATTKPLLKVPDETIVRALEVAQRAI